MKRGHAILWPLCALAFLGCATPYTFDKAGSSEADFRRDNYECERDARQSLPQFAPVVAILVGGPQREFRNFHRRCMEARGWQVVRDKE